VPGLWIAAGAAGFASRLFDVSLLVALGKLPYKQLRTLLRDHPVLREDPDTAELIRELRQARRRGYLKPAELEKICRWKSARAIHHIKKNSAVRVRTATRRALATQSERRRLEVLMSLDGVSVAMASAILTLLDPRRYGVIDIRVWQLLCEMGAVTTNPSGVGFTFNHWHQFLMIVRQFANQFRVSARDIERSLFAAHQAYQKGTLYAR
jgi:hypothetical protein